MPQGQFRNSLSLEEMSRGVRMLESGIMQRRVAGILDVSQSVLSRMWNRYLAHGDPSNRHGRGSDRTTTQGKDRFLLIQSSRQQFQNATSLNELRSGQECAVLHKQ